MKTYVIYDSMTQTKKLVNSVAETLGDLIADIKEAGFRCDDCVFNEGLSHTTLDSESAILPDVSKDIQDNGQVITISGVYMISSTKSKIASGAVARKDLYATIHVNNLEQAVQKAFGKSFTNCTNAELESFIENSKKSNQSAKGDNPFDRLVQILERKKILCPDDAEYIKRGLYTTDSIVEAIFN